MNRLMLIGVCTLALAGCEEKDDGRLVARQDYGVPASWALKKFGGKDFYPMFYPDGQSVRDKAYGMPDPSWDLDVFRDSVVEYGGAWQRHCATQFQRDYRTREITKVTNGTYKSDYSLKDYYDGRVWDMIGRTEPLPRPFFLGLSDTRPSFLLEKAYPHNDRKGFAAWRAQHPEFVGFMTLGEFDSETGEYLSRLKTEKSPEVRAKLTDGYPDPTGQYGLYAFAKESFRREKEAHFGCDDLWTLHSSCWSLAHVMADLGAKGFFYEATGQEFANWRMAGAYSRGASRQWNIPFGWYTAHWYTGYKRGKYDGTCTQGSNYWTGDLTPGYKGGFCEPWRGLSRTMLDRQNAYGWLIGASFLQVEDWIRLYRAPAADGKKGFRPHETAVDLDNLYKLSKTSDRGVVYAPIALLTPISELTGPSGLSHGEEKHNLNAFFFTLVPVGSEDIPQHSLKKVGNQGCLFNSPFGDCFDILTPDSHQPDPDFVRALGAYKVAFLAGQYRKEDLRTAALLEYVKAGGTLVVSSDRVLDGTIPAAAAGVGFKTDTVASGKTLIDVRTGRETPLTAPYKWNVAGEGSKARVLYRDENGTAAVFSSRYGKGRLVTVACWRMMPAEYKDDYRRVNNLEGQGDVRWRVVTECFSGKRQFDVIRALLAEAQDETMPVKVEGDVQWGLNRTKDGWLLWLMNNKGVIHYANEPEEFDLSKTASVRITFKPTGETYVATVKPGEWKLVGLD